MKRDRFFLRLFLGNLLIMAVVVVAAAAVSYRSLNAEHLRTTYAYQDYLARIAQQYLGRVWPLPEPQVDRICKQFGGEDGAAEGAPEQGFGQGRPARLTVVASDGRVLGDSRSDPARMENHKSADRPELIEALAGRPGWNIRRSETLVSQHRYAALPIRYDGHVVGAVRVAVPLTDILQSQTVLREALAWTAASAIIVFAMMALLINWIWYAPLRRITRAARQMASGDLEHRARIAGPAELADLGGALNALRDNLARQIEAATAQRESLQQVLANLREGVIALDAAGRIVVMNQAASDLLAPDEKEPAGRPLQQVVRLVALVEACNEAAASGRAVTRLVETNIKGRVRQLDVYVAPLRGAVEGGLKVLVTVRDVTDLVRTAAMKAEFVANASHELRTPLATLRAAVDSLASIDPQDHEAVTKFVGMLDRHVRRLEGLTLDLLDLHVVESSRRDLAVETVSLGGLAEWLRGQFAGVAEEKGIALELDVPAPHATVETDRKLVELILQNLVENALKFTPAGGRVTCLLLKTTEAATLRVRDTGCGIRREDQTRVFERFFQADAARSGDTRARGTGLGLAIVKHACERLGARVALESEWGTGTTVTVTVPDTPRG